MQPRPAIHVSISPGLAASVCALAGLFVGTHAHAVSSWLVAFVAAVLAASVGTAAVATIVATLRARRHLITSEQNQALLVQQQHDAQLAYLAAQARHHAECAALTETQRRSAADALRGN